MIYSINPKLCDSCGTCIAVCPSDAIFIEDKTAVIQQDLCIHCGSCKTACPLFIIEEQI